MQRTLSKGSLDLMCRGKMAPHNSTFQVLKVISNQDSSSIVLKASQLKYKVLITDGATFCTALLPQQFNNDIRKEEIKQFSILRITHVHTIMSDGIQSLVLAGLTVISQCDHQVCDLFVDSEGYTSKQLTQQQKRKLDSSSLNGSGSGNKVNKVENEESDNKSPGKGFKPAPAALWSQQVKSTKDSKAKENYTSESLTSDDDSDFEASSSQMEWELNRMNLRPVPISALTIFSKEFYFTARVTFKSDVIKWNKSSGDGSLFHIHLLDAADTQIKGTFYNDACEQFHALLVKGKVYVFANGTVKNSDYKKHATVNNQFELTFAANAMIIPTIDNGSIKQQQLNLVKFDRIDDCVVNSVVDVIGIVRCVGDLVTIKSQKSQGEFVKRDLTLVDDTNVEVTVALWGTHAEKDPQVWSGRPIVSIQAAVVKEFRGKFLSLTPQSIVTLNVMVPESDAIRLYRDKFADGNFPVKTCVSVKGLQYGILEEQLFSDRKCIDYFKLPSLPLAIADKAMYVVVKGTITSVRRQGDNWYRACTQPSCGRKVVLDEKSGYYKCPKCATKSDECHLRYIIYVTLSDHTGSCECSLHNDTAEILMGGVSAESLRVMRDENLSAYDKVFDDTMFQTWICKVKLQCFDHKVKRTIIGLAHAKLEFERSQMENELRAVVVV